jgi:kynurenine 3-monooxygenase
MDTITIIGSGLAGTLMSLYLARRGYGVEVYEARSDPRNKPIDGGRSINLALSCRGKTSLTEIGLLDKVEQIIVPMRARAIHEEHGEVHFQPFGRHEDEYINAIMRTELNALLLDEAEKHPSINLYFSLSLQDICFEKKELVFSTSNNERYTTSFNRIIGADGASSAVRDILRDKSHLEYSRDFLPHGYKELSITNEHGTSFTREHLHLWPRDSFMLLGNPNVDDSITGSLFLPHKGETSFKSLKTEEALEIFFKKAFPDATDSMPSLVEEFFNHPTGNMSTINCSKWNVGQECLLIGDAAHGIIPFFGQGMNCAFEDCRVLDGLLDTYDGDWSKVAPAFYESRKRNTEAVAAMSMDNYREIHHDIRNKKFNLKKQVEKEIMRRYPSEYVSKHVLVMFTNTPYLECFANGQLQERYLESICKDKDNLEEINWDDVSQQMKAYQKEVSNLDTTKARI